MKNIKRNKHSVSGIYCIINLVNGRIYIGSSNNVYKRIGQHSSALSGNRHKNPHLQNSYNKNGKDNFFSFILEECVVGLLVDREQYWIDFLKPDYNIILTNLTRPILNRSKEGREIGIAKIKQACLDGRINRKIKVHVYDLDGVFIKSFESVKTCYKELGVYKGGVSKCINNKLNQSGGYQFRREYTDSISPTQILSLHSDERKLNHSKRMLGTTYNKGKIPSLEHRTKISIANKKHARPVYQYNQNMEFIKLWNSISDAADTLNITRNNIHNSISSMNKVNKYGIWTYNIIGPIPLNQENNG